MGTHPRGVPRGQDLAPVRIDRQATLVAAVGDAQLRHIVASVFRRGVFCVRSRLEGPKPPMMAQSPRWFGPVAGWAAGPDGQPEARPDEMR